MLNFSSVMLGSSEPKALADFYKKFLELIPEWSDGEWSAFKIGTGGMAIGPHSEVNGKNSEPGRIMLNLESDNVQEDFERIKAIGATVIAEPYDAGDENSGLMMMSTFADPDGNYFQICTKWEE